MQRIISLAVIGAALALAMAPAAAQELRQPTPPAKPAAPPSVGPQLNTPQATKPPAIPGSPGQRATSPGTIPSAGPAKQVPVEKPRTDPTPPTRVIDDRGQPVPGAVQVTPTRAYDPATGRYYQTPRKKAEN